MYLLALAAILVALYWPAATLQGIFYVGDILRLNYPARAVYAEALRSGQVAWWLPGALNGYPILAEGQTGAYYPPNLLLFRWLPLEAALNYSLLLSVWIAGAGLFAYARALGLRRGPAFLGACAFMLGGFITAHLNHMNMLAAVCWLPWLLWAIEQATASGRWRAWAMAAAFFGLQGLAGHPQIMLLSAAPAAAQALLGPLAGPRHLRPGRQFAQLALCAGALATGLLLAAAQLVPSLQLTDLSQRGQPLTYEFFTSFSLPPRALVRLLQPFTGNPYPAESQEMVGYMGILPLLLAALAPLCRRNRASACWLAIAGVGLLLTLGHFNPAYRLLWHLPVVNKFRVPARYLLWVDLAIAVLAAMGADSLLARTTARAPRPRLLAPGAALSLVTLATLWSTQTSLEALLAQWRWLPLAAAVASGALLAALLWRPPARLWLTLAVGLLLADLGAFVGVQSQTYNATMPAAELAQAPDSLHFLQADAGPDLYRIYTPDDPVPGTPVLRESLFPNTHLLYGLQAAGGYYPLVPAAQEWMRSSLTARLLDLLNVRYVLVPQQLPAEGRQDFFVAENPFARSLAGRSIGLQAQGVAALEAEGCLLDPAGLAEGAPVAEIVVRGPEGEEAGWTLRAGVDIAAWDDAQAGLPVVRTWPARFDVAPPDGLGRTFQSRHVLASPIDVQQVEVRALIAARALRLERLRLLGAEGEAWCLPAAAGEGDHILVYCSPGVTIYRNEGAGPRAFLAHRARVVRTEEEAYGPLAWPFLQPQREVILLEGPELQGEPAPGDGVTIEVYEPEYVRLRATSASRAYLVLADSDYPGWRARVDGRPAPVYRADLALRAVLLEPGEHVVEFDFQPPRWYAAALVTAAGWAALAALAVWRP